MEEAMKVEEIAGAASGLSDVLGCVTDADCELVAKAICKSMYGDESHWVDHTDVALAAINAIAPKLNARIHGIFDGAKSELVSYRDSYTGKFADELLRELITPNAGINARCADGDTECGGSPSR